MCAQNKVTGEDVKWIRSTIHAFSLKYLIVQCNYFISEGFVENSKNVLWTVWTSLILHKPRCAWSVVQRLLSGDIDHLLRSSIKHSLDVVRLKLVWSSGIWSYRKTCVMPSAGFSTCWMTWFRIHRHVCGQIYLDNA